MRIAEPIKDIPPLKNLRFLTDWYQATGHSMVEEQKPWTNDLVYRVSIEGEYVRVMSFCTKDDITEVDESIEGTYDDLDSLPKWMQERIALLSMLSYKPPTVTVEGVGRRISKDTYWVYRRPDSC